MIDNKLQIKPSKEEADPFLFPRCEYYTRYAQSSHFCMNDERFWGTYFRSTGRGGGSGRFTQKDIKSKTFKNHNLFIPKSKKTNSYSSHAGTFHSPFKFNIYTSHFNRKNDDRYLINQLISNFDNFNIKEINFYDALLDYKNSLCHYIANTVKDKFSINSETLKIYHHNDYPCLMVNIPSINNFKNPSHWNQLFMAYFVAFANRAAEESSVPIELVIRSSFGHNCPTIDVTANSLRINIGLVPQIYCEVLIKAINDFSKILIKINKPLDEYELEGEIEESFLTTKNKELVNYKKCILPKWKGNCFDILGLKGDKKGNLIIYQIIRKRSYIDLLTDVIISELNEEEPDFTFPIARMLSLLTFDEKVSMNIDKNFYQRNSKKWIKNENPLINSDDIFWNLINSSISKLNINYNFKNRVLLGLYDELESINKEFIIDSVSSNIKTLDGIGSDSDEESEISYEENQKLIDRKLYSKKLITSTGMLAIGLAHYLARYYLKEFERKITYNIDNDISKHMYYETQDNIKLSKIGNNSLVKLDVNKANKNTILFFDLNHCDTLSNQRNRLENYLSQSLIGKIVSTAVLDYTSSTTKQMKDAIGYLLFHGIKLILLVNSGLKNEQFGADVNPYGTVRIVTLDKTQLDKVYGFAKDALQENGSIPATAHKIRKNYKNKGFSPTNKIILEGIENFNYFKVNVSRYFRSAEEIENIKQELMIQIDILFNNEFVKLSEDEKLLLGKDRSQEIESLTVIRFIEVKLCEKLILTLKPKAKYLEKKASYYNWELRDRYNYEYSQYEENLEDGNCEWDYDGTISPSEPSYEDEDFGNLDDVINLIDKLEIEKDELCNLLNELFAEIGGTEYIMKNLNYDENNFNIRLVSIILKGCNITFFDDVNLDKPGFSIESLKISIKERIDDLKNELLICSDNSLDSR